MDSKARKEPLERLHKHLARGVTRHTLSIDQLHGLEIHATQVDASDIGYLQFDPVFFEPLEPKFLEKYPIDTTKDYDRRTLWDPRPIWDDSLKSSLELADEMADEPWDRLGRDEELIFEEAARDYEEKLKYWQEEQDDPSQPGDAIDTYMNHLIKAPRQGLPKSAPNARFLAHLLDLSDHHRFVLKVMEINDNNPQLTI